MKMIVQNQADTKQLAIALAKTNPVGSLWLTGDLGAGKTTLTRYLLRALGHTGAVKSPTYTLVEPYHLHGRPIYHADLYRLNDPEELDFIGFFEYFDEPNALIIIEWASRAQSILPQADMEIKITRREDDSREVEIIGVDFGDKLDLPSCQP